MTGPEDSSLPIVLIVEDDPELADMYAHWLRDSYLTRTANSAEAAKSSMDDEVDVVLLDRKLPGASGDELLDWIRGNDYNARVAMITAMAPDFDVIEMGFDAYVEKPLSADEMRDVVQMLLTRTIFDQRIQRYLELTSKKDVLENEINSVELEENENYQRLANTLSELRVELDYLLCNLDDDYFASEIEPVTGPLREDTG